MSRKSKKRPASRNPRFPDANPPPSASQRRRWLAVFYVVGLGLAVIGFMGRGSIGLWQARRALSANRPFAALEWIEWADEVRGPDRPEHRLLEALALTRLGYAGRAAASIDVAEKNRATPQQLRDHRQLVAIRLGDMSAAQTLSQSESVSLPFDDFFNALVHCAMFHGQFDWGHSLLDEWQEKAPGNAAESYLRGRLFELQDRFDESLGSYRMAIERQGSYPRASFRMGVVHRDQRELEAAETAFRACLDSPYARIAKIELAEICLQRGDFETAQQFLDAVGEQDPRSTIQLYLAVEMFVDNDRFALLQGGACEAAQEDEAASKAFQAAIDFNQRNLEAQFKLAAVLRRLGRGDEASVPADAHRRLVEQQTQCIALRTSLEDSPDDLELRCDLAELVWQCESVADAHLELEAVFTRDPYHRRAKSLLRRIQTETP
jgi:tetratricopeptide (TPR) repeat protein